MDRQGFVTTYSADSAVTDSAAAATAMATGHKVNNGVISTAYPGNGNDYITLLELYKARGARTGLVTSDAMTGATPAGFGAHDPTRNNSTGIAADYLTQTRPNVLLGGGGTGMTTSAATAAGYTVVTDRAGMQAVNTNTVALLSGQFGSGSMPYEYDGLGTLPHLHEMAATALDIVDNDPDGFFLVIEGGNIDHAGHSNDINRNVFEVLEFNTTVQTVLTWATGRTDTLIIVTADHETGGMTVTQNNGQGQFPTVAWTTTGHTATNVRVFASGPNSSCIGGTIDNTQIFTFADNPNATIAISTKTINKSVRWAHTLPPNADSFTVRNAGVCTLDYTITSDADWLAATPLSGTSTGVSDTIWLSYDVDSLLPGLHVAHIQVSDPAASNLQQTLTINLTVMSAPGDLDGDMDVDQADYGRLQECYAAPGAPIPSHCVAANLDGTGTINADDLTVFRTCTSGAGIAASPFCAD
jgi:alkaline phosphatase